MVNHYLRAREAHMEEGGKKVGNRAKLETLLRVGDLRRGIVKTEGQKERRVSSLYVCLACHITF
jgi:hypothetical protein